MPVWTWLDIQRQWRAIACCSTLELVRILASASCPLLVTRSPASETWSVVKVRGGGSAPSCFGLSPLLQFEPHLLNAWPGLLQIKSEAFSTIKTQIVITTRPVVVSCCIQCVALQLVRRKYFHLQLLYPYPSSQKRILVDCPFNNLLVFWAILGMLCCTICHWWSMLTFKSTRCNFENQILIFQGL